MKQSEPRNRYFDRNVCFSKYTVSVIKSIAGKTRMTKIAIALRPKLNIPQKNTKQTKHSQVRTPMLRMLSAR